MNPAVEPPHSLQPPGRTFTLSLVAAAGAVLGGLLLLVLIKGPEFASFPGRIIGISLLSNVDPHYRISIFLLLSALSILACFGYFSLVRRKPISLSLRPLRANATLLLCCVAANLAAAALHPERSLFLAAAAHSTFLLGLWVWSQRQPDALTVDAFVLRLTLAWQATTLLLWGLGLPPGLWYYIAVPAIWLGLERRPVSSWQKREYRALQAGVLTAPLALTLAIEAAYFLHGEAAARTDVLLLLGLAVAAVIAISALRPPGQAQLAWLGAAAVLVSTVVINQYDHQVLYKGYDLFHLPEKLLPLHQWENFRSVPFLDYHPGHGVFDMVPQAIYHWLNQGNPLEALVWGSGYFLGWTVQALYIFLLFALLAKVVGAGAAFFLLWLLPVFQIYEPYNALLMLPLFNLLSLPASRRPIARWCLQWVLTLLLMLWRADFGLIVLAGNLIVAAAQSWFYRSAVPLRHCLAVLAGTAMALTVLALMGDESRVMDRLLRSRDLMEIQILAASYDRFFRTWNHLAWVQYVVMPALGACAGAYSLSRVYLRGDRDALGLHLVVIFLTAIGFALSIRLFQRHSLVEGFTKTNFFYFAPLLLLATLAIPERWRSGIVVFFFMGTFLLTPKTEVYRETSPWSPRKTYPVTTHSADFPTLLTTTARLEDRVTKYDSFKDFTRRYLQPGESFYDFSNAPMLYMLADIRLPVYVYESVWHTSEKVQHSTLLELESLRREGKLPFVVFRQNKPRWDALDGVDNALRGYHVSEYIYRHFSPCVRVGRFDLWMGNDRSCEDSLRDLIPEHSAAAADSRLLDQNYLVQAIDFGSLPYLWANYDAEAEQILARRELPVSRLPTDVLDLDTGGDDFCRLSGCYLDLVVSSQEAALAELRLAGKTLATFQLRPGTHRYRLRTSALWRWHQRNRGKLRLVVPGDSRVTDAALLKVAARAPDSGNT